MVIFGKRRTIISCVHFFFSSPCSVIFISEKHKIQITTKGMKKDVLLDCKLWAQPVDFPFVQFITTFTSRVRMFVLHAELQSRGITAGDKQIRESKWARDSSWLFLHIATQQRVQERFPGERTGTSTHTQIPHPFSTDTENKTFSLDEKVFPLQTASKPYWKSVSSAAPTSSQWSHSGIKYPSFSSGPGNSFRPLRRL